MLVIFNDVIVTGAACPRALWRINREVYCVEYPLECRRWIIRKLTKLTKFGILQWLQVGYSNQAGVSFELQTAPLSSLITTNLG